MNDLWVIDASPLITLAKVGLSQLLELIPKSFLLPEAVVAEITAGPASDPARMLIESRWGQRATPTHLPDRVLEWGLGSGETSVLALTIERAPAIAVLDDATARSAARALSLPVIGTAGVIIQAKLRGLIPSAARVIADLQKNGLFLDNKAIQSALNQIGESIQE